MQVLGLVSSVQPVKAAGQENAVESLQMTVMENVSLLDNGTARITVLMNVTSARLAGMYRRMFGIPDNVSAGEQIEIPENATQSVDAGENTSSISVPVRDEFYGSIEKEQLLSLGLKSNILESRIVPRSEGNGCEITIEAEGSFEISSIVEDNGSKVWNIGLGPFDATGITGLTLSKLIFTQSMLKSLNGSQNYQSFWQTIITPPSGCILVNSAECEGRNWTVNFGGGTYLSAQVHVYETQSIVIQEQSVTTEENITASPTNVHDSLGTYKTFNAEYLLANLGTEQPANSSGEAVNTNWSFQTDWIQLPEFHLSFEHTTGTTSFYAKVTLAPQFRVDADIGWQFHWQWWPPAIIFDSFHARMTLYSSIKIRFEISASYDNTWEKTLCDKHLTTFYFFIGIPAWIDLRLGIDAVLNVEAQAWFVMETTVNSSISIGAEYHSGSGWSQPYGPPIFQIERPSVEWYAFAQITVIPSIRFRLEFMFFSAAGPYVEIEPYAVLDLTAVAPPASVTLSISIYFRINLGVKWTDTVAGILRDWLHAPADLIQPQRWTVYDTLIPNANWTIPLLVQTPPSPQIHDMGISNIALNPSPPYVDSLVNLNVTVNNSGNQNETSDVAVYLDNILQEKISGVYFASESDTVVPIIWNTSGISLGSHALTAAVAMVTNETDLDDNMVNMTVSMVSPNDVALISLISSSNSILEGDNVNITALVANLGEVTENMSLEVFSKSELIGTEDIQDIHPNDQIQIEIPWNTSNLSPPIDFYPETLNLKSKNQGITVVISAIRFETRTIWARVRTLDYDINETNNVMYGDNITIEHTTPFNLSDVDLSSLLINGTVPVDMLVTPTIGDYDNNTIPDLTVCFNQTAVAQLITSKSITYGSVTLATGGKLESGEAFESLSTITVRMPGDLNIDGKVDIFDAIALAGHFGSYTGSQKWDSNFDENGNGAVDIFDVIIVGINFGKQY